MLKSSKGPWRVGLIDETRVEDAMGNEVAQIDGDYNNPETWQIMEANARLISAAPQLLEGGIAQTAIIHNAQLILTQYLQGQPRGLNIDQAIGALLGLLDGQEQRESQEKWDGAIKKVSG